MAQRHGRGGRRPGAGSRASGSTARDGGSTARGEAARGEAARGDATAGRDATRGGPAPGRAAVHRTRLRELIEPVVTGAGYDLEGLGLSRAGRRHLVRLTVDRDGGVNLDAVAEVSRLVSAALDAVEAGGEELFSGEYELQVSSPGVDRALTLPRHWRRNVGRLVEVRTPAGQVTGRVVAAAESGVVLEVRGARREVPFEALGPGRIQLEFTRLAAMSDADLEDMLDPIDDDGDTDDGAPTNGVTSGYDAVTAGHDEEEDGE
jgi:ribosome maturation factor RimP